MKVAALVLLLSLLNAKNVGTEGEREFRPADGRQLSLLGMGVAGAGFGLAGLAARYFAQRNTMVSWENDKDWEKRFLTTYLKDLKSKKFLNLILDNLATSVSNNCMIVFKRLYEPAMEELDQKAEELLTNSPADLLVQQEKYKKDRATIENELYTNFVFCDQLYEYITSHGHLSKYILDVNYMLFYFKNAMMKDVEVMGNELAGSFLDVLSSAVEKAEVFKHVQEVHKKYMYITVNYFLGDDLEMKMKNKQGQIIK